MGTFWKVSERDRKEIVCLYADGVPVLEIAKRYSIDDGYVCHLAHKAGVPRRDLDKLRRLSRRIR